MAPTTQLAELLVGLHSLVSPFSASRPLQVSAMDGALSDDDEPEPLQPPNARPSLSKKAERRSAGGKRQRMHSIPIPLKYQEVEGGFQEYKLAADKRVYRRREYAYVDDNKVGTIVQGRPDAPKLFSDKFLFTKARELMTSAPCVEEGMTKPEKLQRQVEVRIVRHTFAYFVGCKLQPSTSTADKSLVLLDKANKHINLVINLVFPGAEEWGENV